MRVDYLVLPIVAVSVGSTTRTPFLESPAASPLQSSHLSPLNQKLCLSGFLFNLEKRKTTKGNTCVEYEACIT
jgi:hypothetical protein